MRTMAEILKRAEVVRKHLASSSVSERRNWDCELCQDKGYILHWDQLSATPCVCLKKKRMRKLFQSAMIPEEFQNATFSSFRIKTNIQKQMKEAAENYLKEFERIRHTSKNSFGFIAEVGEWVIHQEPLAKQGTLKEQYSNYGMGKTHLTVAMAKELLQREVMVLVVNDAEVMDELAMTRMDDREKYEQKVKAMGTVDVLVWDDLGKSNGTDFKRRLYYSIINQRYLKRLPIIFTSNECLQGLDAKIGSDTFSRLMGMTKMFLEVRGEDIRLG